MPIRDNTTKFLFPDQQLPNCNGQLFVFMLLLSCCVHPVNAAPAAAGSKQVRNRRRRGKIKFTYRLVPTTVTNLRFHKSVLYGAPQAEHFAVIQLVLKRVDGNVWDWLAGFSRNHERVFLRGRHSFYEESSENLLRNILFLVFNFFDRVPQVLLVD